MKKIDKKYYRGLLAGVLALSLMGVASANQLVQDPTAGDSPTVGGSYDGPIVGGSYDGPIVGGSYDGPIVGGSYDDNGGDDDDDDNSGGNNSGTNGNGTVVDTSKTVTKPIGTEGGVLEVSGIKINIPAGALGELQNVTVKTVASADFKVAKPAALQAAGQVISITVGDAQHIQLGKPVTISLSYDKTKAANPARLAVFYEDEAANKWLYQGAVINKTEGVVTFTTNHFSTFGVFVNDKQFPDTLQTAWAQEAFDVALGGNMINGYPNGQFMPNKNITRAEFVSVLVNALGLSTSGSGNSAFEDVQSADWFFEAVTTAQKAGIAKGVSDSHFDPNKLVTREEIATYVSRAFELKAAQSGKTLTDAGDASSWAQEAINKAVEAGVINGYNDGSFKPANKATRAEALKMVVEALKNIGKVQVK